MKSILVYQDYIHNNGALMRRLNDTFEAERIARCDASDIAHDFINPETVGMFVMPGGADLYFCEKLNGPLNQRILSYVERGGTYLGICAGAYYASRRIEWAKDTDQAIVQNRELGFFAGTAIGPIDDFLEDRTIDKSWKNIATLKMNDASCPVLYESGPIFAPDADSRHTVLAHYDMPDNPAALIEIQIGKGRAILSACHIEYTPELLRYITYSHRNPSKNWELSVLNKFEKLWTPENDIWNKVITPLARTE